MCNIKIFVSHRIDFNAEVVENEIFVPIRSGAVYDTRDDITIIGDNTGDNISERGRSFCELTAQYWAWKNVDADYIGLCHYRRFFNFSEKTFPQDIYTNVLENYISPQTREKYQLDNIEAIKKLVSQYDIIATVPFDTEKAGGYSSIRAHYAAQKNLEDSDTELLLEAIKKLSPEYLDVANRVLNGKELIPCSMFIMKKEYFDEYSKWLFSILFEVEQHLDFMNANIERVRTIGHLGERLLAIYIEKNKQRLKVKLLQRVLFFKSERNEEVNPLGNDYIPVVLTANDYYVPYLYCALFSLMETADKGRKFDIIILHKDISEKSQFRLEALAKQFGSHSVRFYQVGLFLEDRNFIANAHITIESFFRLFIPEILKGYKKILWLDSDMIVKTDIASFLLDSSDDKTISATRDADFNAHYLGDNIRKYADEVLKLDRPEDYFQAGFFVFNIERFHQKYALEDLLNFASSREFCYMDQDIMNVFFKGDIEYRPMAYNVLIDCFNERKNNIRAMASADIAREYLEARKSPKIIHYAGGDKPWNNPDLDFASDFWEVARKTMYYEIIMTRLITFHKEKWLDKMIAKVFPKEQEKRAVLKDRLNKIVTPFAPLGSKRRRVLKKIYHRLRGR